MNVTRRDLLLAGSGMAGGAALSTYARQEDRVDGGPNRARGRHNEEYIWLSANRDLPLFVAHDHQALKAAAEELGVRYRIEGPSTVDIPGLVAAVEQSAARRPTGMMVVGWDESALIPAIDKAVESGVPVVCVDADVPRSKRLAFIGTDWFDLGVRQAEAMLKALSGQRGKVAMFGLIDQAIDQQAFNGFRSVMDKTGQTILDPIHDKGNQAEATRLAAAMLQSHPDLIGMAGFDSESGPGIGQAIKEARKAGQLVATCVEAEPQQLRLVKDGVLTACIGQKRELFTYIGLKALHDLVNSPLRFSTNDRAAGVSPIPVNFNTGTYTVTRENVDLFLK